MKVLILLVCALAVARAGWIPVHDGYKGTQHIPVIHEGVPTETPEVQHAKAAHFAALAEASSQSGYQAIEPQHHGEYEYNNEGHSDHGYGYSHSEYHAPTPVHYAPVQVHYAPEPVHHEAPKYVSKEPFHPAYETTHVLPAIGHDGKPLDTPEVEEAKHNHFAEFAKALAATAPHQPEDPHHKYNDQDVHYRHRRDIYEIQQVGGYHGPQHVPVIKDGVPVETTEVQHARAAHFAALAEASSRPGYKAIEPKYEQYNYNHEGQADHGYGYSHAEYHTPATVHYAPAQINYTPAPVHHAREPAHHEAPRYISKVPFHPAYETSHVLPAIGHDGTPLDTPEVEEAKHNHFTEFSKALAATAPHKPEEPHHNYHGEDLHYRRRRSIYAVPVISEHGVPVEPIEVQVARSAHLAAHHAPAHGYSTVQVHDPVYGVHYEHWTPKYDHYGHPLDIEEVEHAKQAHFHAHKVQATGPVDTFEVAHARAEHLASHAAVKVHHY